MSLKEARLETLSGLRAVRFWLAKSSLQAIESSVLVGIDTQYSLIIKASS